MASERENNGPTQVHPLLNYNDLTQHINGMNGITNGLSIITNPNPFGERGKFKLVFIARIRSYPK